MDSTKFENTTYIPYHVLLELDKFKKNSKLGHDVHILLSGRKPAMQAELKEFVPIYISYPQYYRCLTKT